MKTVLLLIVCWSIFGPATAEVLSKKVLDFLTYITGDVDNKVQVNLKGTEYDLVQVRARRVSIPSLESNITVFVEQATNGVMKFFHLGVVTEGPGNTLNMQLYNFTEFADMKFGSFDLDKISQVKLEHLRSTPDCVASFEIWGKGLMTGVYPNCRYTNNGKHPSLIITYMCDFNSVLYPPNTDQKPAVAPYVLTHKPVRERQKDAPEDYTSPCDY